MPAVVGHCSVVTPTARKTTNAQASLTGDQSQPSRSTPFILTISAQQRVTADNVPSPTAILDRFLHRAEIITITGRIYPEPLQRALGDIDNWVAPETVKDALRRMALLRRRLLVLLQNLANDRKIRSKLRTLARTLQPVARLLRMSQDLLDRPEIIAVPPLKRTDALALNQNT